MGDGEHPGALVEEFVDPGQVEAAVVGQAEPVQGCPGPLGELLPGHQVGVVFHLRHHDAVAGADPAGVAEGVGDEVDALGGVLGEDHFVVGRADEPRDGVPGVLVGLRGLARELVRAAVHGALRVR